MTKSLAMFQAKSQRILIAHNYSTFMLMVKLKQQLAKLNPNEWFQPF